ncbi:MAG TPA: hypothetical protein DD638_06085 [Pasteurellaceae bacterium]|nr:hypothetical protein [Pasteurellaceae bacterium]
MDDLIKELQILAPYILYAAIALTCITIVVAVTKMIINRKRQKLKERARQEHFLFERLLTPNDLNSKDPVITQQAVNRQ